MNPLIRAYTLAGLTTREQILEHAKLSGDASYYQALNALSEGDQTRQNSTAMVVVTADPPGKNVCSMIRNLVVNRTKLIVVAQPGSLAPGGFESLLRASMPDVEKKLRIMDAGGSLADAVSSAERNRHYRPSQALEVFCDEQDGRNFAQEIRDGSLKFDPTVIQIRPMEIVSDDSEAIMSAISGEDLSAMHRVLDPHVFSNQDALKNYKAAAGGAANESLIEGIKQKFPGQQMYVHFSSREKPPQVPNRAINKFAGGSGPIGIYAYPLDARLSFAADRQFAFVLKPKVEVLNTITYTAAQLQVDIERLSQMVDLKRPNKLWLRFKDEAVNTGPPFYQLWYLISRIPRPDEEFPIGATGTGFGDPQKGRDLFIQLGYTAIEDSIGIIYGTEPKQILFLTDESFEVVDLVQNLETFRDHASQKSLVESVAGKICSLCEEPLTREEFVNFLTKQKISGVVYRLRKTVEAEFKYLEEELGIQDAATRARFIKGRIKYVLWAVDDEKLTADTIPEQEIKKTVHDLVAKLQKIIAAECQEIERGLDIRDPKASWSFIQPRIQNIISAINSEKPVDESILRESAGPIRVYHGSNRRIENPQDPMTVKALSSGMDYGPGMYFTTNARDAMEYGFNLYQADVDLKNPLMISSEMTPEMDKFRKSFGITDEDMSFADEGIWLSIMEFVITLIDVGETTKKGIMDRIKKMGHDGIIVPAAVVRERKSASSIAGDYVIVFDPATITNWGETSPEDRKSFLKKTESTLHEFLSDISPSRELAISKLDDILANKLGDSYRELQYLGTGRNGSAYKTPDGLIIKITTDPVEAASAEALEGKACEYLYNVHEVSQIDENVWVILQESLDPLPHEYCEEFDLAVEIIETIGAGHALREGDADGVRKVMVNSGHADLCILVAEIMKKFGIGGMLREISQHGLSADFHSGNVKLRKGKPVLTDLGTTGDDPHFNNKVDSPVGMKVNEFAGLGSASTGSPSNMRGSNSSAWAGGRMVISKPEQHVPEDENASERDQALDQDITGGDLDWGIGKPGRGY